MKWTTLENMTHGNNRQPILPGSDDESMDVYSEKDDPSSDTVGNLFRLLLKFDQVEQQTASFDKYKVAAKEAVRESIKNHLTAFSKKQKAYKDFDPSIQAICEYGSRLLLETPPIRGYDTRQEDKINKIDRSRIFQNRWLTNIPRLLPHEDSVMQILPYLITCYTITASENRLDPFDGDISGAGSGWCNIFVELMDSNRSWNLDIPDSSSRAKSIDSLCNRFLTIDRRKNTPHKKDTTDTNDGDVRHKCASFWEYYRRFAAFCLACRDKYEVNITLSTALFWDIQKRDMFGESYPPTQDSLPWLGLELSDDISQHYAMRDIASDGARDEILELFDGKDEEGELSLHEIAYYSNLEDIEDMRSKEASSFLDELTLYKNIDQFGAL